MNYWLVKSEPDCFSIDDLINAPNQTTFWDGVRNYQARNMLRDEIKINDQVFYYHSNAKPTGIVGTATVVKEGYPDSTAWDPTSDHPDPKSTPENPLWYMVDIKFQQKFARIISLSELRENPLLKNMQLLRKGNRLSVMPVNKNEWDAILAMLA